MTTKIHWPGQSGRTYEYWIHPLGTAFKDAPGNYVFAKQNSSGSWVPAYIGQTGSLRDRLADHEKEACAHRNGATHIHVHTSSSVESIRRNEESDLIARWQPACNTVGVSNSSGGRW